MTVQRKALSNCTVAALKVERDTVFWDRDLVGFGVRVYPTGGKVYVAQTRESTGQKRPRRVTIGRHGVLNTDQARQRAALMIARIRAGEEPLPLPLTPERDADRSAPYRRQPGPRPCPPTLLPEDEGMRFVTTLMDDIRAKVSAYLERTGMPDEEFGKRVLGRPQFVEQLAVQRTMTLKTADRLLQFLGEAPIGPVFRREVEAFLDVTGRRAMRFGVEAAGYPWFVETLSDGATTRLSAVERVRAWMVDTATPSERAVIARKLEDTGSSTFIHGASTSLQGERPQRKTSLASDPDQAAGKHPPEYHRQVFLTRREAARFFRIGMRTLDRL